MNILDMSDKDMCELLKLDSLTQFMKRDDYLKCRLKFEGSVQEKKEICVIRTV